MVFIDTVTLNLLFFGARNRSLSNGIQLLIIDSNENDSVFFLRVLLFVITL